MRGCACVCACVCRPLAVCVLLLLLLALLALLVVLRQRHDTDNRTRRRDKWARHDQGGSSLQCPRASHWQSSRRADAARRDMVAQVLGTMEINPPREPLPWPTGVPWSTRCNRAKRPLARPWSRSARGVKWVARGSRRQLSYVRRSAYRVVRTE